MIGAKGDSLLLCGSEDGARVDATRKDDGALASIRPGRNVVDGLGEMRAKRFHDGGHDKSRRQSDLATINREPISRPRDLPIFYQTVSFPLCAALPPEEASARALLSVSAAARIPTKRRGRPSLLVMVGPSVVVFDGLPPDATEATIQQLCLDYGPVEVLNLQEATLSVCAPRSSQL